MREVACGALLVVLTLALPATSLAASGWYHDRTYGLTPRPLGDNNHPNLMATDGAGNVYVADNFNHRALKFSSARTPVLAFGTAATGLGGLRNPQGVGVSPVDGSVYVSDSNNRKIEKYSAAGQALLSFGSPGSGNGQFNGPSAITVKADGEVWVSDTGNNRIQRFSSAGAYLGQFGTAGTGAGQFAGPRGGCFASDGTFYVADTGNNRVQRFSATGTHLNTFGSAGTGNGQFTDPYQVGCDPSGTQFVVADSGNDRVQRFNASFAYAGQFGSSGTATGQFTGVRGVAIDSSGRIWASDYDGNRVQVFSSTGTFVGEAGADNRGPDHYKNVFGVATNAAGTRVYVSDTNNHRVQYYDGSGNWLGAWGTFGTGNGQFNLPYGIAVASNGDVLVADRSNNRVQRFTANGAYISQFGSSGTGNGQFQSIWDIAISPVDGSVLVVDNAIPRVQKFTSAGAYVAQVGASGAGNGQFSSPNGIGVDSTGAVYVADSGNSRVQKFTAALAYTSQWGTAGTGDGQFSNPSGIAVLPDDTVVVVENDNPRIQQFTSAGAFLRKAGTSGIGTGQLGWPRNAKAGADGSLYIADASNSRAVRWRLATAGPPNTLFVHDTNAQAGTCGGLFCVTPTDISAAQPHYSWINQYGATVTGQRTRVHTDSLAGVVGLWHLDGSGADASGNAHTLTPYGSPTWARGATDFGRALALGANSGVSSGPHARYNLSTFTVDAWFRGDGTINGFPFIVDRSDGTSSNRNYGVFVESSTQRIGFTYSSGGVAQYPAVANGNYFDGLWHHVAATSDGTTLRLYIDGVERASGPMSTPDNPPSGPAVTMAAATAPFEVDEVRISNVARSADEIAGYYRTRLPHAMLLWDSSPTDTPVANGSCAASARCADIVHGAGGSSPLGPLRGGRFTAQAKFHDGTGWSDWSPGDWFEQTTGRPSLMFAGNNGAQTDDANFDAALTIDPRLSWTNNKGRANGTIDRRRIQVVTTPLDDVVALWQFDGSGAPTGPPATTFAPYAAPNDPGWNGATGLVTGTSADFDGDDVAVAPASSRYALDTFTVESWVQLDGVTSGAGTENLIIALQNAPTDRNFRLSAWVTGAARAVAWCDISASGVDLPPVLGTTNIADGGWHHVACVVDSGPADPAKTIQVVVDGRVEGSATFSGNVDNPADQLAIGGRETFGNHLDGRLDSLRLSSVARTVGELRGAYLTGRPHFHEMYDSDPTASGSSSVSACADLTRCGNIRYLGTPLAYNDARYYARATYKSSSQPYWTAWSDWDWFETDTPPAPTSFRAHDTNANPGSINPTTLQSTTPHMSFTHASLQDAVAQRVQVLTTTLDDVVGLWRLDGSGGDTSATGNAMTFGGGVNAPTFVAGATGFGQALRFDGDDNASIPTSGSYDLDEFTVELWFRTALGGTATFPTMVVRQAAATNRNFSIFWIRATNDLCVSMSISGTQQDRCVTAPVGWRNDTWHHLAFTRTAAGSTVLYVDGVAQGTWSIPGNVDNPVQPINVGHHAAGYATTGFVGEVDDLRVSRVARSAAEILGSVRTRRPHATVMWDSNPADDGAAMPTCPTGNRCADVVYGTGGGQLPLVRNGARYHVRAKVLNQAGSWSAWGRDWFEVETTLTVGVDSATRSLGTAVPGSDVTGTSVMTVTTNNATGYQLSATDQSDTWALQRDASTSILDWTGTDATPTTWTAGTSGFAGMTVLGATGGAPTRLAKWGAGTNTSATDFTNNLWAGLRSTSSTLLHQRTGEHTGPDTVTVAWRTNVASTQPAGAYAGTVTLTAVANP